LQACIAVLRIRDVYPGSRILIFTHPGSRIPNLGSRIQKRQQKRGVKKICCPPFFCSHKFNKIDYYFVSEMLKKKIWTKFQRIFEVFTPKNCHQALKNMGLGSGIWKKPIPDPGSRGQKGTGSRIRNTDVLLIRGSSKFFCFILLLLPPGSIFHLNCLK
jgi:hypothetical protein